MLAPSGCTNFASEMAFGTLSGGMILARPGMAASVNGTGQN